MKQNELSPAPGAVKNRKRVGRGNGSGHGTFSGRGCNGQKSRRGFQMRPGFEGGQLPIIKRLPRKRGFVHIFRGDNDVVNVGQLNIFTTGSEVTLEDLLKAGLLKSLERPVKILSDGEINIAISIQANKISAAAKTKIEKAGGKVVEI
jgi:large subunit ribosomal protein L15